MGSRALIYESYSYPEKGNSDIASPPNGKTVELYNIRMLNRPGVGLTSLVGLLQKMSSLNYKVYTYDGAAATEVTDFSALEVFGLVNGNGIILQSSDKFGMLGLTVSQAEGGTPVYAYEYYDGSAFQTLTTMTSPTTYSLGEQQVMWAAPIPWVLGSPAIAGLEADKYTIRITSSTAPTTAVIVSDLWMAKLIDFQFALGNNAGFQVSFDGTDPLRFEAGEGILPFFGIANANNLVSVTYRLRG